MSTQVSQSLEADMDKVFRFDEDTASQAAQQEADDAVDTGDEGEGDGSTQEQQPAQTRAPNADVEDEAAGLRKDERGRTLDKDGNVIAENRQDRRVMYMYDKARRTMEGMKRDGDAMRQELNGLRELSDVQKRLKLDTPALIEAAQFRAQFDINPIQTVREIVAQAVSNGYTMDQLFGPDAPAAINASVIQRTIDERLRPITDKANNEQREQRINADATEAFQDFLTRHEHADTHGNEIAWVVENEGVSPEVAYYKLQARAAQLGLDFTQNLPEQMIARQEARNGNGQKPAPRQQQRMLPGNRTAGGNDTPIADTRNAVADPQTSFKDIVAAAMRNVARNPQ